MNAWKKTGDILASTTGLLLTLLISFAFVVLVIFVLSKQPLTTMYYFFIGPFTNKYYFGNMLSSAVPLVFTGLGIAMAFKSSVFNLGGEGQVYAGGLVTTVVCLALPHANGYLGGILAIAAGVTAGAALATISGLLKAKWNTDELITSFLLSAAVSLIVDSFITGPLDDPNNSLLTTRAVGGQFRLPGIFPPSKLSAGAFIAVAMAVIVFLFIYRSHWGYEMRTCGLNREFARYGGINVAAYLVTPMAASGALHGAAGGIAILGTYGACLKGFSAGMGWNGIAVALIAKNNPIGVLPAALFFAYLDAGAKAAMLHSDVTFEIAALAQSAIFYLVTAQALYGALRGRKRKVA